jgi:two-component system phosphate regulon sensor histidine kinase PhoR
MDSTMKFRTKILILYIVTATLITSILAVCFFRYGESRVRHSLDNELLIQAKLVAQTVAALGQMKSCPKLSVLARQAAREFGGRVTIVTPNGTVIADSATDYRKMENHAGRPEIKAALSGVSGSYYRYSRTLARNLIYVAYPIRSRGVTVGALRLARDQADLERLLVNLRLIIFGGIALTLFFPLGLGVVMMNRITKPILELQRMASGIAKGDLNARVRLFGSDELADLGLVFNGMAQQLSESFATIHDEKSKLEVILENMADGIIVINRDLKITLANRSAQVMLGIQPDDTEDRTIIEAVLNHHLLELIQDVNLHQEVFESELALRFPVEKQLQVFLAPLKDQAGVFFGSIVVLHDLTQIRRLERVRQDFVANVSHELRTPISAIKAMTETLLRGAWRDNTVFLRYLESINNESDRLSNLINDLLALAKLDVKPEIKKEPVDLGVLIAEVKERFAPTEKAAPQLEVVSPPKPLPLVSGNRDQLKQVLINLLDNAFKYTPSKGQIRVSAWQEGEMVKIAVADSGMGIPLEEQSRIFERFYRVDKAHSREIGGTGLGLSIVKHIVESHGGRIEVKSSPNRGSVFSFTVPVA